MIFRLAQRSIGIRDDDLHAYADGLLDGSRRRRVEQHLAAHPEDAERVAAFRRLNAGLADLAHAAREEELGPAFVTLREDLCTALIRQRQVKRTLGGAMASLLLLAATSGTWLLSGWESGSAERLFQTASVDSVPVASSPAASLEISDGTEDEIADWLLQRVEMDRFSAPDLNSAGFTLSGARVVPMPGGPLIQVLYRNDSQAPLTFSVSKGGVPHEGVQLGELSDRQLAVYWRRGSLIYSLVGPLQHGDLATLADLVGGPAPDQPVKASEPTSSAQATPEQTGVVLIDSKSDVPATSTPPAAKSGPAAADEESVKAPPATTAEKIEEPKPL